MIGASASAFAQDYFRIENRWKPSERINHQRGEVVDSSNVPDGYHSAMWEIELFEDRDDSSIKSEQLKSRWKGTYLHNEGNILTAGAVEPHWQSRSWRILPVSNGSRYFRIQSVYTKGYLHIENGRLEVGEIQPGWYSAMWSIEDLDGKVFDREFLSKHQVEKKLIKFGETIDETFDDWGDDITASSVGQWFSGGQAGPKSITFKNDGVFAATMNVTYFIKQANGIPFEVKRSTEEITLGRRMHINIPDDLFPIPVVVEIRSRATNKSELLTEAVDANFTGNRCFKSYGSIFDARGSTC